MRRLLRSDGWWANPLFWVEQFLIANVAFLALDIALAHAVNAFEKPAEWIPVWFSIGGTLVLVLAMAIGGPLPVLPDRGEGSTRGAQRLARWLGLLVGWGSIAVGVAGLVLHLEGDFFREQTLKNLVYTAPFTAPLAYAGLGFLVLLNRMVDSRTMEWSRWVLLLSAGGFVGNFILSLADHAQNGFFYPTEWIGVIGGALAVGFLMATIAVYDNRPLIVATALILAVQMVVGLLGFYLHGRGNLARPADSLWNTFVFGAPIFAPLLFNDLALLGLIGLWGQARCLEFETIRAVREPALAS